MSRRALAYRLALALIAAYCLFSVAAGIVLAEYALHPGHRPLHFEREARQIAREMGARLEDVSLTAPDGTTLAAWHATPARWNGSAVILLHGVSDNREGVGGFARLFLEHGYSVLLPDVRAHGLSGGALAGYGLREAGDVHAWTDWLYARRQPVCVFGFGESMGAGIIVQAVRAEPRLCGVVAESPFGDFREAAYDKVAAYLHIHPALAKLIFAPAVEIGLRYARSKYDVDMVQASPARAVQQARVPVLLIHGTLDHSLRPRQSELIRAANPRLVTLWEVQGAGHCGASAIAPEQFRTRVLDFYAAHLPAKTLL
ncbi:MAG TPA: alpha/beta hydrolase [Terriglobales bacterium]|nr:alpha/beta hydrolase [Terriglobales bacterium]